MKRGARAALARSLGLGLCVVVALGLALGPARIAAAARLAVGEPPAAPAPGQADRAWLGVALQPLTPGLAAAFGVSDGRGALVADVVPESPAARAGLRPGDVVRAFEGQPVAGPDDLARLVGRASPGQEVTVTVWRDRQELALRATLGRAPGARPRGPVGVEPRPGTPRLGLEIRPVTPELARELDLRVTEGVVVTRVEPGSPAERAGLARGDVILEVDRTPVRTAADVVRLTREARADRPLTLRVQRGDRALYVAVRVARE